MTHHIDSKPEYKIGDLVICVEDCYQRVKYEKKTNNYFYKKLKHESLEKGHIYKVSDISQYGIVNLEGIRGSSFNHWKFRRIR